MAFGFGFGALHKPIVASGGGGGPTERIQTGDFASSTGWAVPAGWAIAAGHATGANGENPLVNTLTSPVANGADISAFRMDLTNAGGDEVTVQLVNSSTSATFTVFDNTTSGTGLPPSNNTAGATGPYDKLRIFNADGINPIVVDNITLVV